MILQYVSIKITNMRSFANYMYVTNYYDSTTEFISCFHFLV